MWSWGALMSPFLLTLLSPTPELPPPFTLQELQVPLIDAQTCDTYYHDNSIPSMEPVILEDMLCAGFEEGKKDACNVSRPQPDSATPGAECSSPHHAENLPRGLGTLTTHTLRKVVPDSVSLPDIT